MSFSKETSNIADDPARESKKLSTDMIAGTADRDIIQEKNEAQHGALPENEARSRGGKHQLEPLFEDNVDGQFRSRWREIQAGLSTSRAKPWSARTNWWPS